MGTPDLSEFVALTRGKARKPCTVADIAATLTPEQAEGLYAAVVATDGGNVSVSAVVEWCKQRGHPITQNQVVRHRQGRCVCDD